MANIVTQKPLQSWVGDVAQTTHAAANVVYGGSPGWVHQFLGVSWSYANSVTVGATAGITVLDGANVVFKVGIANVGQGQFNLPRPKDMTPGNTMTVTLADGGSTVVGALTVDHDAYQNPAYPTITGFDLSIQAQWALWFPLFAW